MKIVNARRISQLLFFALFLWLTIVTVVGYEFTNMRGWPVNIFLQLDPLVALSTILTTHTLYGPLLWALATVALTIIVGRFFCGWLCPFGTIHQFVGYLAHRKKPVKDRIQLNKYRPAQKIKYFILFFLLGMTAFPSLAATLQIGLLDPIPLVTRSFTLVILPIADQFSQFSAPTPRLYTYGWLTLAIFLTAVGLNLIIPRFYCRFICPLGAMFGLLDRFAIWRIGRNKKECINCKLCERACEGGCEPAQKIRISECVLCLNCLDDCKHGIISYQTKISETGEVTSPDVSRRGVLLSAASGFLAVPAIRLAAKVGQNWQYSIIRPPGAIEESEFLKRCIKCGQCMRICPTNVIQPAGIQGGIENLWTPILNNRIGSSGCQLNCVACGQICPTSAIRPITIDEKLGLGKFKDAGPITLGTAFFDRNRCLPWAMDKPCLVCQENCPVSPKAIFTREVYTTVRDGQYKVKSAAAKQIEVHATLTPYAYGTGDYYCLLPDSQKIKIAGNSDNSIDLAEKCTNTPQPDAIIEIQVRLQRPYVDIDKCIGCGVCEHECPVSGKRAVRVSGEGETRSRDRRLTL